jgi:hypothetical protein
MQSTQSVNLGIAVANQTGSSVAGAVASSLSMAAAMTPPPFNAIFAIGAALTGVITKMLQGCGQSCVAASNAANEIEPLLQQNLAVYTSTPPGQRTTSLQQNALANFTNSYNNLVAACQQVGGQGGTNCIKDRQVGACHWKASPWKWNADGTFTPAGAAGSGSQCWNWVYGYHDAIASDPYVVPDSPTSAITSATSSVSSALSSLLGGVGGGSSSASPLILVGLGLAAIYLISD